MTTSGGCVAIHRYRLAPYLGELKPDFSHASHWWWLRLRNLTKPQGSALGELPAASKLVYEAKRMRKFVPAWTDHFPWLRYTEEGGEETMHCSTCRNSPDIADTSSSLFKGTGSFRYDTLSTHAISKRQQLTEAADRAGQRGPDAPLPPVLTGLHRTEETMLAKMTNIMHTAYYVAKEEQPFTRFTTLHGLINRTGGQLPNCYASNKACERFVVDIYEMEQEKLLQNDGATDTATLENELVYVRYMDKEGPVNSYSKIEDVKHANAAGVLEAVYAAFNEAGLVDWKERLVGFGSDGAVVNVGCRTDNTKMQQLQATLVSICERYHYAPKALRELRMIAEAMEEKVLKPTTLHGARWVPYVHRVFQKDSVTVCEAVESQERCFWNLSSLKIRMGPCMETFVEQSNGSGCYKEERRATFQCLSHLMHIYMVLPVSTAVCERGFSTLKRVKTDWRSSLTTAQLQRLMFISIEGPALEDFDAASAAQRWWTSSLRRRRPGFNPWSSRET
ncbi:hypothetical protein AAFF_G00008010 [Aldrovandia affinis]|uniref:HAT C-terminal dimerisation domain-containing protein n=1 Tax=Aldrovandia affinis TaxID=143900 RepID=A0AAD7T6I9_9TELE|nr:hypothetical protein AAFF_G00008010 [Aldrovandia affinis]